MTFQPKIVALLCNWCSYAGADLAGVSRFQYPPTTRVIKVMCSTRVEPSFILKSFVKGADGVLVGGCHLGDCHYVTGNYYTVGKMNITRKLLASAGIDPKRLRLEWISASEGEKFAQVVTEFTEELKEKGPFPEDIKNSVLLRAALNVSFKPRIRILATKERMLTEEGNKYGEVYTSFEFDRVSDEIIYDEINEEMIRLILQEQKMSLDEIAKQTRLNINTLYLYLMDFIKRGEVSFEETEGIYYFSLTSQIPSIPEPKLLGGYNGDDVDTVVLGAGADGISKAVELTKEGKKVLVVDRHPAINQYTIRKHSSSFDIEAPVNAFYKLVDDGAIQLLTSSWVKKINDESIKVIQYPSKVNKKCNNCNICYEVCPLKTINRERTLFSRKAAYGIQDVPSTYTLEKETPFCQTNCPGHVDVRKYVAKIAEGKFEDSVNVIRERLVLPAVLGRVCPHPCEELCRRNGIENPISVRLLKRFVADWEWERKGKIDLGKKPSNENNKYKVAIIGSGPAGLTVAYDLVRKGYNVTIFEALPVAGGMLAVGIPSYRLPKDVLKREIDAIITMGVELRLNTKIGKDIPFEKLTENYDAVFIGIGSHECKKLGIDGEDCKGSILGVDFLRDANISPESVQTRFNDKKVIVVGGGDVAIDAARCAVRFKSRNVTIVYRRSRQEMPARDEEIEFAEREGINIRYLTAPSKIIEKNGVATGLECVEMELGEPDASGRRKPVTKKGSEFVIDGDIIISAIGQYSNFSFLPEKIERTQWGINVNDDTAETSMQGVFAGGDAVTGPWIVIGAVGWGRKAANAIDAFIHGREVLIDPLEKDVNHAIASWEDVELMKRNTVLSGIHREERAEETFIPVEERLKSFKEVELLFDEKTAVKEARRCLSCRECLGCGICGNECIKDAINYDSVDREIEIKTKDIVVDSEIYFTIDEKRFTAFELDDMLELGIVMNWDGKKPKSISMGNDNKYVTKLKDKLKNMGVKLSDNETGMTINTHPIESEYYKEIKKIINQRRIK